MNREKINIIGASIALAFLAVLIALCIWHISNLYLEPNSAPPVGLFMFITAVLLIIAFLVCLTIFKQVHDLYSSS